MSVNLFKYTLTEKLQNTHKAKSSGGVLEGTYGNKSLLISVMYPSSKSPSLSQKRKRQHACFTMLRVSNFYNLVQLLRDLCYPGRVSSVATPAKR